MIKKFADRVLSRLGQPSSVSFQTPHEGASVCALGAMLALTFWMAVAYGKNGELRASGLPVKQKLMDADEAT
jgi:hypothetical protein